MDEKLKAVLRTALTSEQYDAVCAALEDSADDDMPEAGESPIAMDTNNPIQKMNNYLTARQRVEAVTGSPVMAQDAAGVFTEGLRRLGVNSAGIDPRALPAMFTIAARGQRNGQHGPRPVRQSPAEARAFASRFPDAGRVKAV